MACCKPKETLCVFILRFHNGNGVFGAQVENVVGFLRLVTGHEVSLQIDFAVCNPLSIVI